MSIVLERGVESIREVKAIRSASTPWDLKIPMGRKRKNLLNLYGLGEPSQEIYEAIMRADDGKSRPGEEELLELYIEYKKREIRKRKMELGIEGYGSRRIPGRIAETWVTDLRDLFLDNKEEEESDEY